MRLLCAALTVALRLVGPAQAAEELPRKVLGIYNKREIPGDYQSAAYHAIHQQAEMPLNHLGLELIPHDLGNELPAPEALKGYVGVLSWFLGPHAVQDPDSYCRWLSRVRAQGLKIVMLGDPGVLRPTREGDLRVSEACTASLEELGYAFTEVIKPTPLMVSVSDKEPEMVEFERKLDVREMERLTLMRADESETYLRLRLPGPPEEFYDQVAVNPGGGIALDPFVLHQRDEVRLKKIKSVQLRWRLNPFRFFEEAFGVKGRPRPDATTLNGRRIFYSHIDGDGFFNVSEFDQRSWSAAVFMQEILEKHPESPFTVSVITGYYDMARFRTPEALGLSRKILTLPNAEPASHGYAHPLIWHRGTVALNLPGYRFDPLREIVESTDFINRELLPPGRKAELFQWTGSAVPRAEHLAIPERRGLLNLNGGDTQFDRHFNSYAFVSPLGRLEGAYRQIYASNSNENVYTGLWHGPYYGYREVLDTFKNTETPRRVKPVNVYVHFYSAEKLASLKTLKEVYAWAFAQPLFPIRASEFARLARDFYEVRLSLVADGVFKVDGGARIRTIRFDDEPRLPDLRRSRGVIGWRRQAGSLYVSLSEEPSRLIALGAAASRDPVPEPARGAPYLVDSNFDITAWRATESGVRFFKRGWWTGEMSLAGLDAAASYRVSCDGFVVVRGADEQGRLSVRFPDSERGGTPREVRVERAR